MSTPRLVPYVLGFLAFAAICAAWAAGGVKSPALAAPRPRLLYVSDPTIGNVAIFSLPKLALVGTLTGFSAPHGLCADDRGNVWVTSTGARLLLEYQRGGTSPIATLSDPTGFPFGCVVDRSRQKLLVANIRDAASPSPSPPPPCAPHPSGPGEIEVFDSVTNTWMWCSYNAAFLRRDMSVAVDPPGNAYVVGLTSSNQFALGELPAGKTQIRRIKIIDGTINYPGMVQWYENGHYLAVGDRRCGKPITTCVYEVSISGSTGKIIGETKFKAYNGSAICDMAQGTIYRSGGSTYLAGGDDESSCGYAASSVEQWAFPAGGTPINSNPSTSNHPFGTAISR
jgi:hypothetical protein